MAINIEELQTNDPAAGALSEGDLSLAEIANLDLGSVDAVRFENLYRGVYAFEIEEMGLTRKGDENVAVITAKCKVIDVDTLIDTLPEGKDEDSLVGKFHTEQFWLKDEDGIGRFRAFAQDAGLGEAAGTLADVINALEGHRFMGMIKITKSKNDPSIEFANLNPKGAIPE